MTTRPKNPNRNGSKDKGTRGETGTVRALWRLGITSAKRNPLLGGGDQGDIFSHGVAWQIKAGVAAQRASQQQIDIWMTQTLGQAARASAEYAILVTARVGYGPPRAEHWWAWMVLQDLAELAYHRPVPVQGAESERLALLLQPVRVPLFMITEALIRRGLGDSSALVPLAEQSAAVG